MSACCFTPFGRIDKINIETEQKGRGIKFNYSDKRNLGYTNIIYQNLAIGDYKFNVIIKYTRH